MKQTNNAIKFLMAQYRAIFKNAYFKGLTSAVVVTASLAAGAANADTTLPPAWQWDSSGEYNSSTVTKVETYEQESNKSIAGAVNIVKEGNGNNTQHYVTDGNLILGTDGHATSLKDNTSKNANAYGGYAKLTTTGNLLLDNNKVTVNTGLSISGSSIYGAFGTAEKGSITAQNNNLTITTKLTAATGSEQFLAGARAYGFTGANAIGNKVSISGKDSDNRYDLTKHTQVDGGLAKTSGAATGVFVAKNNEVTLDQVKIEHTTTTGAFIISGRALISSANAAASQASALDNTLKISNANIKTSGSHIDLTGEGIGANVAIADNMAASNSATVIANGSAEKISLDISNSHLESLNTSNKLYVAGGFASTKSGTATANNNSVKLTNTTMNNVGLYGGTAQASGTNATLETSNNSISLEKGNAQNPISITSGAIIGAQLTLGGTAATTNTLTANGNTLKIGEGFNFTGDTEINSVKIEVNTADSSIITAKDNKIEFDSKLTGSAADKVLYSVYVKNAGTASDATKFATLTGNSVTIGANAEIDNYDIAAVYSSGAFVLANNNDVTIQGKVKNGDIIGGAGADSLVSLESTGTLIYQSGSAGGKNSIISDNIKIAGTISISSNDELSLKGYYVNGKVDTTNSAKFNTSIANIDSTAHIYNQGKLELFGQTTVADGASLHAMTNGAQLIVNGGGSTIDDDVSDSDTPVKLVGGRGSMKLSLATLNSYLKAGDAVNTDLYKGITEDQAGAIVVKSGGVVEFTDKSVVLSDLDFVKDVTNTAAGKIGVEDGTSNKVSIFKGNEITIAHAFAGNATQVDDVDQLTGIGDKNGIQVQANVLNLGSSTLTSDQSKEVIFDEGVAKEQINFKVTSGEDGKKGFLLVSDVVGSNFMRTRDQLSGQDYFTALKGTITGNVKITGDTNNQGSLKISDGNWTAQDTITVAKSGALTVGGTSLSDNKKYDSNAGIAKILNAPDATLTLDKALVLDVSEAGTAKVEVDGQISSQYDLDRLNDTPYHQRFVMLDLSKGITLKKHDTSGIQGEAEINVTSGGVIRLDANNVNDLLAQNNATGVNDASGAFFKAASGGTFDIKGDVEAIFEDFSASNNGFNLDSNGATGILKADSLTVTNKHVDSNTKEDSAYTKKELTLGGTVQVQDLTISDYQRTTGEKKPGTSEYASTVGLASGTAEIGKSLSSSNHILQLGNASTSAHIELATAANADKGSVKVNNIELLSDSSVKALVGNWDASSTTFKLTSANSSLIIGGDLNEDINEDDTTASLIAGGVVLGADSYMYVAADGSATVNGFDASGLKSVAKNDSTDVANSGVVVAGTLVVNGDKAATSADGTADPTLGIKFGEAGSIQIENNGILKFSAQATNAAILKDGTYKGAQAVTDGIIEGYSKIENKGGELHLGLANTTTFDGDAIKALKGALFTTTSMTNGVLNNGGILNIGDASFNGVNVSKLEGPGLSGYTATWESLKNFSDVYGNDVTNNQLVQTNVSDIKPGDQVQGHWGSLSVSSNTAAGQQVDLVGDTSLRFASGNNGFFISNASHNEQLGANVAAQKSLSLIDGGKIGKITLQNGKNDALKNVTTLEIKGAGTAVIDAISGVADSYGATLVLVNGNTEVVGDISNIAYVDVGQTGNLKAKNATVSEISTFNSHANIAETLTLNGADIVGGSVVAKDAIYGFNSQQNASDDLSIVNGGLFKADTLTVTKDITNALISVGSDDLPTDGMYQGVKVNGTGYLEVGTLELNGATLVVDPAYGSMASVSSVMRLKHDNETYAYANDAGTLHGNLLIGKNAIQSIGANKADTLKALADYIDGNGSLDEKKYGSVLYLNGQITLTKDSEIALNAHSDKDYESIRNSLKYTIENQALDQYADLGLGTNTAIFMTEKAFENDKGERTGTAIYFDRNAAVVNGLGGEIVLAGDFDAATPLNIFNDLDDNGVDVKGSIDVRTQNGFLFATLKGDNQGKGVQLEVDHSKAYSVMNEASNPVVETLISYHEDRFVTTPTQSGAESVPAEEIKPIENTKSADQPSLLANGPVVDVPGEKPETPDNGETQPKPPVNTNKVTGSSEFLNEVVNTSHGAPAEAAARLAVYGGAVQSALAANNTSTEAIAARMGIGASEISSIASNGQGGTLWVTPVYKSQDSDSFGAQGLDYGVDLNLYGLALGGDIEIAKNFKVGAMFNIGSGDADGKGNAAAANTSNDFNYYGFAVYGGYSFDAFSLSADIGYTVVDNDLEAKTGMQNTSKLTASTDTTALTFGVTGKYTLSFDSGLEIAPHAGLRYTRFDMDSYTIKGNADVASFDGDTLNVFSIPVGVTVAKEFVGESWTVKPSLDFTLTGNFGDDEIKGDVSWTGVNNLVTQTTSEFMDNFTYGLSAGVSAQTGSFVMGAGISYSGSSNMNEFGVNANARFLF